MSYVGRNSMRDVIEHHEILSSYRANDLVYDEFLRKIILSCRQLRDEFIPVGKLFGYDVYWFTIPDIIGFLNSQSPSECVPVLADIITRGKVVVLTDTLLIQLILKFK